MSRVLLNYFGYFKQEDKSDPYYFILGRNISLSRVLLNYFGYFKQEDKSDPYYFILGRNISLSVRFCCITNHPKCGDVTIICS